MYNHSVDLFAGGMTFYCCLNKSALQTDETKEKAYVEKVIELERIPYFSILVSLLVLQTRAFFSRLLMLQLDFRGIVRKNFYC